MVRIHLPPPEKALAQASAFSTKFALRASEMCLRHVKYASRVKFSLRESGQISFHIRRIAEYFTFPAREIFHRGSAAISLISEDFSTIFALWASEMRFAREIRLTACEMPAGVGGFI
ncbi:MAG: hypothetical protein J5530_00115 [Clostridia bacterium]|nr:hypothetical protein [Clostridia bacterium]